MLSTHLELALLFLRLGATAFGGPAAHIALMERELVSLRQWLTPQEFLDLIGAANLIPGPTSTEVALHIGHKRAGLSGLCVAGIAFILPAALMVLGIAFFYQKYGTLAQARWLLTGIQPVVLAIVAHALWRLSQTAIKDFFTSLIAVLTIGLAINGVNEIALVFGAAFIGLIAPPGAASTPTHEIANQTADDAPKENGRMNSAAVWIGGVLLPSSLFQIFWTFLKIGSLVYGSGYVLLAFLRTELVENLQWITDRQLLDAVAIGQVTPGPLFTSATFIGYLVGGVPGSLAATVGIFLPAFIFSAIVSTQLKRWTSSPRARRFLDAVNAASLALMAVVTVELGRVALNDAGYIIAPLLFLLSLAVLWKTKVNSLWLILFGACSGYFLHAFG